MLTVKKFRDSGGKFEVGDRIDKLTLTIGGAVVVNKNTAGDHLEIKSFAWRPLNTLPDNPKFKYEDNLITEEWRPLLDQSALKPLSDATVKPSDDKPVFTQAMADKKVVDLIAENVKLKEVIKLLVGE